MGRGRVNMLLKDGRIITLLESLHIPYLAKSLISVSRLGDVGVDTLLGKGTCKMVQGEMASMRGVWCGTMYKLLGRTHTNGCNSSIVLEHKHNMIHTIPGKKTMPWHQIL
jgi:hypothetical protein